LIDQILLYLLVGAGAGILAGLLGIGGGIVTVPAIFYILSAQHISEPVAMHLAVGTSTAAMTLTTLVSANAHRQTGAIRWDRWRQLAFGLIVGSILGAMIVDKLPGHSLRLIFAVCEILLALQIAFGLNFQQRGEPPGGFTIALMAVGIGIVCSMLGLGGGLLVVPFLLWLGHSMRTAIATAAATGVPISFSGAIAYLFTEIDASSLPDFSWGHIYIPAFIGVAVGSVALAPTGVRLTHRLPAAMLKKIFAAFIAILGVVMLASA